MYPSYNPYFSPYMPSNPQPRQVVPQFSGLMGEMVTDIDAVRSMRVDMSGQRSYYPTIDGSTIYSKALMPDGTAQIIAYKQVPVDMPQAKGNDDISEIKQRLDAIDSKIAALNGLWGGSNDESNADD